MNNVRGLIRNVPDTTILDFANEHGFYYEPFYGWTTIPRNGKIFSKLINFDNIDCDSSHVIGLFKQNIVEFYKLHGEYLGNVIIGKTKRRTYVVAQAMLPKKYGNIVILRNKYLKNIDFAFGKLNRFETESNDFNKKYLLWSEIGGGANSLELLSPSFMEKIMSVPFDLNIEIMGNVLYMFTDDLHDVEYENMLEILALAFDEMKK